MKNDKNYKIGLCIALLSFATLSACVSTRQALGFKGIPLGKSRSYIFLATLNCVMQQLSALKMPAYNHDFDLGMLDGKKDRNPVWGTDRTGINSYAMATEKASRPKRSDQKSFPKSFLRYGREAELAQFFFDAIEKGKKVDKRTHRYKRSNQKLCLCRCPYSRPIANRKDIYAHTRYGG